VKRFLFVLLSLFVAFTGCTRNSDPGGSVEVGNGMQKIYFSTRYGFSLSYSSDLSLKTDGDSHLVLDNSLSVARANKSDLPASSLEFKAEAMAAGSLGTLNDLIAYAEKENSGLVFKQTGDGYQSSGIYSDVESVPTAIHRIYYFLSPQGEILHFTLLAYQAADGIRLLEPVMKTMDFDGTPPALRNLWIDNRTLTAGDAIDLWIDARDEYSGMIGGNLMLDFAQKGFTLALEDQKISNFHYLLTIEPEHYDSKRKLFHFKLPTNPYAVPGDYFLRSLSISDLADNYSSVHTPFMAKDISKIHYTADSKDLSSQFPVRITLNNDHPDTEPAEIFDLWTVRGAEPPTIRMDREPKPTFVRVFFKAKDNLSGVEGGVAFVNFCLKQSEGPKPPSDWLADYLDSRTEELTRPQCDYNHQFAATIRIGPENVYDRENNIYQLAVRLPYFIPSGAYVLQYFSLRDRAGNSDDLLSGSRFERGNKTQFIVENPNRVDNEPPVIHRAWVFPEKAVIGTPRYLYLDVSDDSAGFINGEISAEFCLPKSDELTSLFSLDATIGKNHEVPGSGDVPANIKRFRFELKPGAFTAAGEYIVERLILRDADRRQVILEGVRVVDEKYVVNEEFEKVWGRKDQPTLRTVKFQILR